MRILSGRAAKEDSGGGSRHGQKSVEETRGPPGRCIQNAFSDVAEESHCQSVHEGRNAARARSLSAQRPARDRAFTRILNCPPGRAALCALIN